MKQLWLMLPLFALMSGSADGCMCAEHIAACQAYAGAAAVFAGTVTEISVTAAETTPGGQSAASARRLVHFKVEKTYRGSASAEIQLSSSLNNCEYEFRVGGRYLVYANVDEETHLLSTSICTRSRPLEDAKEDLDYFAVVKDEPKGTLLFGRVRDYTRNRDGSVISTDGLAGVHLELKGPQGVSHAKSDGKGNYSWSGLPAGSYQLSASLRNYVDYGPTRQFELPGQGCFELNPSLHVNGQISGRVLDPEGNPLPNQTVQLVASEGSPLAELTVETDESGAFHFTGVRPGEFLLGVNLSDPPNAKSPYVRTYFPESRKRENAMVVELSKAGELINYDIRLLQKTERRVVKGTVLWPDGKPAADAQLTLIYPDYPWQSSAAARTNAEGRFSVEVLSSLRTKLDVQKRNAAGFWVDAGDMEMPIDGPIKYLTIILNRESPGLQH